MPARPLRTCVSCRRRAETAELHRIARTPEGRLGLDERRSGRGAWVCAASPSCVESLSGGQLTRLLRTPVGDDEAHALRSRLGTTPVKVWEDR